MPIYPCRDFQPLPAREQASIGGTPGSRERFPTGGDIASSFSETSNGDGFMSSKLKMLAIAAAMAAGTSSVAMAQVCPAGTAWNGATCAAAPGVVYAPSNPVSGAAAGGAAGAATETGLEGGRKSTRL